MAMPLQIALFNRQLSDLISQ